MCFANTTVVRSHGVEEAEQRGGGDGGNRAPPGVGEGGDLTGGPAREARREGDAGDGGDDVGDRDR